jgi:peptide/nickel transport system substrate-binding protein
MATTPDHATEVKDSQLADKILWQDLPTIPLYQKPTLLAYTNNLLNVRDDASVQGPLWNAQEWGTAKGQ